MSSRISDFEIARLWVDSIRGKLYFHATCDAPKTGEFYRHLGGSAGIRYLSEPDVQAKIMAFLLALIENGASIRITPSKIKSVRTLAGLLLLQEGK